MEEILSQLNSVLDIKLRTIDVEERKEASKTRRLKTREWERREEKTEFAPWNWRK